MVVPTVQAVAGVLILTFTMTFGDPVSLGTLLGLLLLVSAAARYAMTRGRARV